MPMPAADLAPYLERLRELPFVKGARLASSKAGPTLAVTTTQGPLRLSPEVVKSNLAHDAARRLAHLAGREDTLVLSPYVGARVGEDLARAHINYLDAVGNCDLRLRGGMYASVRGKVPPRAAPLAKPIRAAGYQVLFALLADPELAARPLRAVADAAGASRQAASDMRERLVELGFAARASNGVRWIEHRRRDALELWLAGYAATLRPRLFLGAYQTPDPDPGALEARLERASLAFRYGGTAAAFRLDPYYRGARTVIHAPRFGPDEQRAVKAVPRRDGPLLVHRTFGTLAERGAAPNTVHPLLVYAELLADPDPRAREAGERIRREWVLP